MRLLIPIAVALVCIASSNAFTISSLLGGTDVETADGVLPEYEIVESAEIAESDKKKPVKPKPHKPVKPSKPIKPVVKPGKPIKQKKPLKALKYKKIKKIQAIKKKKLALFSKLTKPFFWTFTKKPVKGKPHKVVKPTKPKIEYVEVTKKLTVHPVCYITLKKKKPCIAKPHYADFDDYDEDKLWVEEDKGELEEAEEEEEEQTIGDFWSWGSRNSKELGKKTISNVTEPEDETGDELEVLEDVELYGSEDDGRISRIVYTVDAGETSSDSEEVNSEKQESEENRKARYIDVIEPPAAREASEESEEYLLESSENSEEPTEKDAQVTKTILVTRIERYTDTAVTATVIAKNCAPVNPHVPKCKKKKFHDEPIIRDRPEIDAPIVIQSTPVLADNYEGKASAEENSDNEEDQDRGTTDSPQTHS